MRCVLEGCDTGGDRRPVEIERRAHPIDGVRHMRGTVGPADAQARQAVDLGERPRHDDVFARGGKLDPGGVVVVRHVFGVGRVEHQETVRPATRHAAARLPNTADTSRSGCSGWRDRRFSSAASPLREARRRPPSCSSRARRRALPPPREWLSDIREIHAGCRAPRPPDAGKHAPATRGSHPSRCRKAPSPGRGRTVARPLRGASARSRRGRRPGRAPRFETPRPPWATVRAAICWTKAYGPSRARRSRSCRARRRRSP